MPTSWSGSHSNQHSSWMLGLGERTENLSDLREAAKVPHSEAHKLRRQVSTLSEFGKRALRSDDIDGLLQEATRLVSDAIDVELVKVLELLPGGENLLVRAGVNWNPGVGGHAEIPAHEGSPAGYALHTNQPVITEDTERDVRFEIPKLLIEHSVKSTVNVVSRG